MEWQNDLRINLNYCKYSNPAYDEKVSAAMKTKDAKESVKFMKEAEDILMADYPFLPLYSSSNTMLVSNKIDGWMLTATGRLYFRYADLVEE